MEMWTWIWLDNMNISNLLLSQLLDWWGESGLESLQQHSLPDVEQLDWVSLPKSVHPQAGKIKDTQEILEQLSLPNALDNIKKSTILGTFI